MARQYAMGRVWEVKERFNKLISYALKLFGGKIVETEEERKEREQKEYEQQYMDAMYNS